MTDLDKTREELDAEALAAGIPAPEALATKQDVLDAIERGNPALVPDPPAAPGERVYEVVGPRRVHDTEPGGRFAATLDPAHESSLIEAGHIIHIEERED